MSFIEREFMEPERRTKALQFDELGLCGGEVVFLGDSITAGGACTVLQPLVRSA